MKKDIKDYLHLYLGCQFVMKIDNPNSEHHGQLTAPMYFGSDVLHAALCKGDYKIDPILILRPLSSITEEERQKLFDQIWPSGLWSIVEAGKSWVIGHILDIDEDWSNLGARVQEVISIETWSSIINWLRKNKFDCDDLIDSGLAINAETLK